MNQLSNFEQQIKDSFDDFEVPYNPDHWKDMQRELNTVHPSMTSYFGAITSGLAAVGFVFIAMLFFVSDSSHDVSHYTTIEEIEELSSGEDKFDNEPPHSAISDTADYTTAESRDSSDMIQSNKNKISDSESKPDARIKKSSSGKKAPIVKASELSSDLTSFEKSPVKTVRGKSSPVEAPHIRTGCTGMVINFTASEEYSADAKYLWNFGDGFFSNERNPSHTFNKEGIFDVSLSVTSKKTGQISSNVVQAMIEVVESPTANVSISVEGPKEIKAKNDSYNVEKLEWIYNNTSISDINEILISVADNTRQTLALHVNNESGCSDSLEILLNSIQASSEFPRSYTRNLGSPFAPGAILNKGIVTTINIYEKSSGNLVFVGSGNKGWNGTNLNGNPAEEGSYEWIMVVEKPGVIDVYKGQVELK